MMTPTHSHDPRRYLGVFAWLVGVTVLEVGSVYVLAPGGMLTAFLLATAAAKATLVALYFMHLRSAHGLVWLLAAFPFVLGAGFVLALFPDIVLA